MKNIVVWDPEEKYWEGSLVDDGVVTQIVGRGGVALPVDAQLFEFGGCGGYMKRAWGAGWPIEFGTPRMFCPLTLYVTKEQRVMHWAARLVPTNPLKPAVSGSILIAAPPPRGNTLHAPITPRTPTKQLQELGDVDAYGGWTIGGLAGITVRQEGNHGFGLYGAALGVRVLWAAVSART
jgi:hypothetical protein